MDCLSTDIKRMRNETKKTLQRIEATDGQLQRLREKLKKLQDMLEFLKTQYFAKEKALADLSKEIQDEQRLCEEL